MTDVAEKNHDLPSDIEGDVRHEEDAEYADNRVELIKALSQAVTNLVGTFSPH